MDHINEIDIIEYAAGNLANERKTSIDRHLGECTVCAKKCAEMSELWDLTGNWPSTIPVGDITQKVLQQVSSGQLPDRESKVVKFRKKFLFPIMRAAAMLVIAAGMGHILGLRSAEHYGQVPDNKPNAPVYLAALGLQWSNDLTWSVLTDDQIDEYEDKP